MVLWDRKNKREEEVSGDQTLKLSVKSAIHAGLYDQVDMLIKFFFLRIKSTVKSLN